MKQMFQALFFLFLVMLSAVNGSLYGIENREAVDGSEELDELDLSTLLNTKVKVSSTKEESIFNTSSTVSVINRAMIRKFNFRRISEVLNIVPGFSVVPTHYRRDLPTSRGILQNNYADKVLVLIDGIPSWSAVTGTASIDRIDIDAVERIEVLKGPASVLYGSNAYSGTINIVLKSAQQKEGEVFIGAGDGTAFSAGGNVSVSQNHIKLFASGGLYNEKGIDYRWTDFKGVTGTFKPYFNTGNATVKMSYKNHSLLFNGSSSSQAFFGAGPAFEFGAGLSHDVSGYLLNYTFSKKINNKIELTTGLTWDYNKTCFARSEGGTSRNRWEGLRLNGFLRGYSHLNNVFSLELGADFDYRKCLDSKTYEPQSGVVLSTIGLSDKTVYEYSVFGQVWYDKRNVHLLLGTRLTKNEFFGTNISSRGTLILTLNEQNSLKFIFGQSFRAPSLLELFVEAQKGNFFGNPDLKPEKSNSIEAAYVRSFKHFFLQTLAYYATYSNKITRISPAPGLTTYSNGKTYKAKGLELELKYYNSKVMDVFLSYNFIDGDEGDRDEDGDYNFKYVPKHSLFLGLRKKFDGLSIAALLNFWSETIGEFGDVGAQHSMDLNLEYTHTVSSLKIRHSLSFKNITDRDVVFPEYSYRRPGLNVIPVEFGYGRRIMYTMRVSF